MNKTWLTLYSKHPFKVFKERFAISEETVHVRADVRLNLDYELNRLTDASKISKVLSLRESLKVFPGMIGRWGQSSSGKNLS